MSKQEKRLSFASDYMRGAHPDILRRLEESNLEKVSGYGRDGITETARDRIRSVCGSPDAMVEFLVGGTQANAVVIGAFLRPYQGVIAAVTGHVSGHEAGAIEAGGHKVLALPQVDGKLQADTVRGFLQDFYGDENHEHMVMPGMVYISQPTESGTLYSKSEIVALRKVCDDYKIPLYLDGARLAYALACPSNDVSLPDIAKLCDVFYIGGTKCGLLFGEAVVIPDAKAVDGFFTMIKQHGALLAKGWLLGLQFDELFRGGLYGRIGETAIKAAERLRGALTEKGYRLCFNSPTNQVFCVMENKALEKIAEKVEYGFWEKFDDEHTVVRFATDWYTTDEEIDALISVL
ncbi:MAG: low specificity L-threonine aldolase [Oscillospiraceae bacterium]|nr:low specificity L-threonine aldolase [Oscillospiraceae bacterium]